MAINIAITTQDIDALARLAFAEAEGVVTYYENQGLSTSEAMKLAYLPIVDTIINRVATQSSRYGTTIQSVINKNDGTNWQYQPISEAGGNWEYLDDVDQSVLDTVESYIIDRVNGTLICHGRRTI